MCHVVLTHASSDEIYKSPEKQRMYIVTTNQVVSFTRKVKFLDVCVIAFVIMWSPARPL